MKRTIPLKVKLTAVSVGVLTLMCAVFALSTVFSANKLVWTAITVPAATVGSAIPAMPVEPAKVLAATGTEAIRQFRGTTLLVMLCLVALGSVLTYLLAARTLRPLEDLTAFVQKIDIHNLEQGVPLPQTRDEVARLARAFQDMTEKLSRAYQVQKRFSANAAHELRTPLAAIQAQLEVFQMKPDRQPQEYTALLESIGESTERLSNLVRDLLSFTNEQRIQKKAPVDLRELLEEIVFELEDPAADKHITITLSGEGTVCGDDSLLQRAFYNLIANGIRYNVPGGSLDIAVSGSQVRLADTGVGIPQEAKPYIFDTFYCVDKSRSRELGGSGLGLAIAKTILEKHGGSICVQDNHPRGSVFLIDFAPETPINH